jgi:tRNA1Val (adenine37-N6)-methyltransferase
VIVCNPPYFTNGVKAGDEKRRVARHADELTLDELFEYSHMLLSDNGRLGIVFPFADYNRVLNTAENRGLYPEEVVRVRPVAGKDFVRVLIRFSKSDNNDIKESELTIETDCRHFYTEEFKKLVEDFYLNVK